jgi:hypothetical protein
MMSLMGAAASRMLATETIPGSLAGELHRRASESSGNVTLRNGICEGDAVPVGRLRGGRDR